MDLSNKLPTTILTVRVAHDLQRQILEMTSLLRVINNYYQKKESLHIELKQLILDQIEAELKSIKLHNENSQFIPAVLNDINNKFLSEYNLVKFPGSILLFEAWMLLGTDALYPRIVLHLQFPGFSRDEKLRNVFQFIFSTSRGFGFPIYFGPEFYLYKFKLAKIFDPFLKWVYTVSHRANQAILLGNKRLKSKRHHPGEFESIIISEYNNNVYKGIDTILHGYFKNEAKLLGRYSSLDEVLKNSTFYYSIGDHAMQIEKNILGKILTLPLITHQCIINNYEIDIYSYIEELLKVNKLLIQKISFYRDRRNDLISKLNKKEKLKFRFESSKNSAKKFAKKSQKLSKKYPIIDKYSHYKTLLVKIRELLFIVPLYMHSTHYPDDTEKISQILNINGDNRQKYRSKLSNSILITFIRCYEKKNSFIFDEEEVLDKLENLKEKMTQMWSFFKERQYKFALKKLKDLSKLSIDDKDFKIKTSILLDTLLPIIAISEFFNKPLYQSVYPESIPQTKRPGAYFAHFLASKYNPIGTKLMKLFNRLAFQNWSYLILKKRMNRQEFFNYILKLPIWKHIPVNVRKIIIGNKN